VIAIVAALAGYYLGLEKGFEQMALLGMKRRPVEVPKKVTEKKEIAPTTKKSEEPPSPDKPPETEKKEIVVLKIEESEKRERAPEKVDCKTLQRDILDFFKYLDEKKYIRNIQANMDTYARFKTLLTKMSVDPPIPAGEGIDNLLMTKNIYHFFRIFNKEDIRLIREVVRNEADTLELNMDLFYKWLSAENRCPDFTGVRPPLSVQYRYAGFFLNTIGGRAYLFRRPAALRLLVSYYALRIFHEADQQGLNSYGLDIYPLIDPVMEGIRNYPSLHFQGEYLSQLRQIRNYYRGRR
jgi:hypothetical protein